MSEGTLKLVPSSENDNSEATTQKKRTRRLRPFPANTLRECLVLAQAIADNNACKPYSRLSLAESIGRSPDSSQFRTLITSSSAYGVTQGGYQAPQIALTPLGLAAVAPKTDEEQRQAYVDAALNIEIFRKLYKHFDQSKIPSSDRFRNTLIRDYALDAALADEAVVHFLDDGKFTGLIRPIAGADRVVLDQASSTPISDRSGGAVASITQDGEVDEELLKDRDSRQVSDSLGTLISRVDERARQVFITHGHNKAIVDQLKELLTFGKFVPVVAEEQDTPSKPVPDKVLESMRSCFAGVIHVEGELELLDQDGKIHRRINENVLIEIGAAMALYHRNFVLLVRKGVLLPSNLQGLYRCDYDGDRLDLDAAMKLLKTFNQFH